MKINDIKLGKLNILDIIIIGVIVVFIAILGIGYIKNNNNDEISAVNSNSNTTFKYSILIEGISQTSETMFKVGDEVYDRVSNVSIGKISNIEIREAKGLLDKLNGERVRSTIPGKIDVTLEIEAPGAIKNGEYLANSLIRIMVGNQKQIKTKYIMCMGTVNGIFD